MSFQTAGVFTTCWPYLRPLPLSLSATMGYKLVNAICNHKNVTFTFTSSSLCNPNTFRPKLVIVGRLSSKHI